MRWSKGPIGVILILSLVEASHGQAVADNNNNEDEVETTNNSVGGLTMVDGNPLAFAWFRTEMPSDIPSLSPSVAPSSISSNAPTTIVASDFPTDSPSILFSNTPSDLSSNYPSSAPSYACHDNPTYTSRLNQFQCQDHAGTDCFQWSYLGLTALEIKDLVEQCPVACNIECGTLETMQLSYTFILSSMMNFLSPESTKVLQDAMIDYLNEYAQPKLMEHRFILHEALLIKQRILEQEEGQKKVRRKLIEQPLNLQVSVELKAFAVGLEYDMVDALLLQGIENLGFGLVLRLTNDPVFRDTAVSLRQTKAPQHVQVEPGLDETATGSLIWFLVLSLILLVGVSVYSSMLVVRKRWENDLQQQHAMQANEFSPRSAPIERGDSTVTALGQVLSFETIVRVLSNRSPSSRVTSNSRATGKGHDEESVVFFRDESYTSEASMSADDTDDTVQHPLTGIIPPMIVYDGFDGDECSIIHKTAKTVVPSRSVHAPSTFADALMREEGCTVMDSSTYDGIVSYGSSCSSDGVGIEEISSADTGSINENRLPTTQPVNLPPRPPSKENRGRSPLRSLVSGGRPLPETSLRPLPRPSLPVRSSSTGSWESLEHDKIEESSPIRPSKPSSAVQPSVSASPRKKWKIPFNLTSAESAPGLPECPDEDGDRLIFHAPRKGKLGLVIQCIDLKGPVVSHVKTYSPLLGQILPGDRILDIDGIKTTGMTLKDVTGIMGGKIAAMSNRWATVFRFVAWRPTKQTKDELLARLDTNPESSALLLSDSPYMDHALDQAPPRVRRGSFGDVMRIS